MDVQIQNSVLCLCQSALVCVCVCMCVCVSNCSGTLGHQVISPSADTDRSASTYFTRACCISRTPHYNRQTFSCPCYDSLETMMYLRNAKHSKNLHAWANGSNLKVFLTVKRHSQFTRSKEVLTSQMQNPPHLTDLPR